MAVINVKKLAEEWFKNTRRGRNADIDDDDIIVRGNIVVPADCVHWSKTSQKNNEKLFNRQIKIVNHKPIALAQISVPASDNVTRVYLEKGIVKGLQGEQEASLPLSHTGLNLVFGDWFKIDPCLPAQELRESNERCRNEPVLSEKNIGRGSISAVIQYKEMESELKFVCKKATLKANAIINYGGYGEQYNFTEIIRELKESSDNDDLDDIQVVNGHLQFTISGEVVFKWDCQHKVVW